MKKYIDKEILMNRVRNKKSITDIRKFNHERMISLCDRGMIDFYIDVMIDATRAIDHRRTLLSKLFSRNNETRQIEIYLESLEYYFKDFLKRFIRDLPDNDMFDATDILTIMMMYHNEVMLDDDLRSEVINSNITDPDDMLGYKYLFVTLCLYSRIYSCHSLIHRLRRVTDLKMVVFKVMRSFRLCRLEEIFLNIAENRHVDSDQPITKRCYGKDAQLIYPYREAKIGVFVSTLNHKTILVDLIKMFEDLTDLNK